MVDKSMSGFVEHWEGATHPTYPTAAAISDVDAYENGKKLRPVNERWFYSFSALLQIVWATSKVVFVLILPYIAVLSVAAVAGLLMYHSPRWFVYILAAETAVSMIYHSMYKQSIYAAPMELLDAFISPEPKVDTAAGLYYDVGSRAMQNILKGCKSLTSRFAVDASLYIDGVGGAEPQVLRASSGFLSGGMRSVLPFALFHPRRIEYRRRWLRVPLARGPRETEGGADLQADPDDSALYESVAVDWSPAPGSKLLGVAETPSETDGTAAADPAAKSKTVYLVLAGLTGGSQEGYVLDFVHHVNSLGHDCFVMIARGLGEDMPCHSGADFHGARLSDAETAARTLRASLDSSGETYSLFLVGFSLGAIIVANLVSKGLLLEPVAATTHKSRGKSRGEDRDKESQVGSAGGVIVNGAVALAGALDPNITLKNRYALRYWLPVLTFGLKDMVSNSYGSFARSARKLYKRLLDAKGQAAPTFSCEEDRLRHEHQLYLEFLRRDVDNVCDFDALHLARYHGFRDVHHYYHEMTSQVADLARCSTPLLVLAARDDPVLHVNTVSSQIPKHFCSYHDGTSKEPAGSEGSKSDSGSMFCCLITATGGHVGWPVGSVLTGEAVNHKWKFSNVLVTEFCESISPSGK